MKKALTDALTSVEVWGGDALNDWEEYDCPDNGDTVGSYAEWCIGADSCYWATINSATDKIRLNGWYVVDGADYFDNRPARQAGEKGTKAMEMDMIFLATIKGAGGEDRIILAAEPERCVDDKIRWHIVALLPDGTKEDTEVSGDEGGGVADAIDSIAIAWGEAIWELQWLPSDAEMDRLRTATIIY